MSVKNHILNVFRQALITFSAKRQIPEAFPANLQALISLLDKTTAEHVNLSPQFMNSQLWDQPEKAPVSCIQIYEDAFLTMGIFILKPHGKLPLHNHPQMHGLIKVIAGQVKIISYSLNTEKTREYDGKSLQNSSSPIPIMLKSRNYGIVTAELNEITIANTTSPPCTLDPDHKNIHEIESLEGPAAFLDVLAPPYDYKSRSCSYYTRLSQVAPDIFKLQEIRSPSWYWTDSHPYIGPDLYDNEDDDASLN